MKRIMIGGTHSGCGKTTITCAILQALVNRGIDTASFKCGPDYIDPMFHSKIIGTPSRNLDGFFCDRDTLNYLLYKNACEMSVIEGVMGFYDGVGGKASSHSLALDTATPAIIVIDCKGMSLSIGAVMQGFLSFGQPDMIAGFIFNRLPESLVGTAKELCDRLGTRYFGRFPVCEECQVESRHLGLITANEIASLQAKMQQLAELAEQHLLMDEIIQMAASCGQPVFTGPAFRKIADNLLKIAVAADNAFCFYYEDNLDLLRELGCEIKTFSPLRDERLPDGISGLLLGGGYPELYAKRLSENRSMLLDIRTAIANRLPTIAECGGFMYLHETMEGCDGAKYSMVGTVKGDAFRTMRLRRFGYIELTAERNNLLCKGGESMPAHEYHYWDSTSPGEGFTARKASNGAIYKCAHSEENFYAGFPHLYFMAKPEMAQNFVRQCAKYQLRFEGS